MARKIYEDSWWYDRLKFFAEFYIRGAFRKLEYVGTEKIPRDGAVIYAPNHCNGLMDPLVVINMGKEKKVFVARADIFKGRKTRKFLTFLKMLPINRRRDGLREMTKAEDTIRESIEVVGHKVKFCILPEGTHRSMHGLLPIGKGVARVAYGACKEVGDAFPIYIVPIGLEYGDYFRFRNKLLVQVGDPINVTQFVKDHPDYNENDILQGLRKMVGDRLQENVVCVKDEANYDAIWELSKISSGRRTSAGDLKARFDANRDAVAALESYAEAHPAEAEALFAEAVSFTAARRKARISINSLNKKHILGSALWNSCLSLIALPYFTACAVASLPVWTTSEIMAARLEDPSFRNSFRLVIHFATWTIMYIFWAVLSFCLLRWYWALAVSLAILPAPMIVYDCFELARMVASDWRAVFNSKIRSAYSSLSDKLKQIQAK